MLVRPHDAAKNDDEWRTFILEHDFGHLILPGAGRDLPVVVPTHFVFDGHATVLIHLAKENPAWAAVAERPLAILAVAGDYTYVPAEWNRPETAPEGYGIPTSYYAEVQLTLRLETLDDPTKLAALLDAQMTHFEGAHTKVEPGDNYYGQRLAQIRGLVGTVIDARSKFKFGGNRTGEHRGRIAERLAARDAPGDAAAREHVLRRLTNRP